MCSRADSRDTVDALDAGAERPAFVAVGRHTVDLAARTVSGDVKPTPTEWQLLEHLLRHPGMLISHRGLLHDVWGPQYATETNYLRQYTNRLRRTLETDPGHPRHLLTEPGKGYRFNP